MIDSTAVALNTDIGVHSISFVVKMAQIPTVVVSMNQMEIMSSIMNVWGYEFEVPSSTITGFDLMSNVQADCYSLLHLSYIAFVQNYGIHVSYIVKADLSESGDAMSSFSYQGTVPIFSTPEDITQTRIAMLFVKL